MGLPEMAFTDGVETVTLAGAGTDGYRLADSGPFQTASDGKGSAPSGYEDPAETVPVHLIGGTAAVRATMQKLTRLFGRARKHDEAGALPVYVKFRPDSSEAWYRSQVLRGRAVWPKLAHDWEWLSGEFDCVIFFERRYFWEADSEAEISLMAEGDGAPGATGGKTITNHDDSGHGNFVTIASGQFAGDVAAPIRLEMTNLAAASVPLIYVCHEWSDTLSFITATLEGESATPLSNFVDANASGGNYNRLTWSAAAETDIATWTFSAADLVATQGRWHRIIARFAAIFSYTDLYLRVKLLEGSVVIFQSEKQLMTPSASLQEIASLPLPPNYLAAGSGVKLVLQATRAGNGVGPINISSATNANPSVVTTATPHGYSSGQAVNIVGANANINGIRIITVTGASTFTVPVLGLTSGAVGTVAPASVLDLDFLQLFTLDGWRKFYPLGGSGIPQNAAVIDEGIGGYIYSLASAVKAQDWTADGAPLALKPAASFVQRLRFLWRRSDLAAPTADTMTVRAYYRPRRLTI